MVQSESLLYMEDVETVVGTENRADTTEDNSDNDDKDKNLRTLNLNRI